MFQIEKKYIFDTSYIVPFVEFKIHLITIQVYKYKTAPDICLFYDNDGVAEVVCQRRPKPRECPLLLSVI